MSAIATNPPGRQRLRKIDATWATANEACIEIRCCFRTLQQLREQRRVTVLVTPGGRTLYLRADLARIVEQSIIPALAESQAS